MTTTTPTDYADANRYDQDGNHVDLEIHSGQIRMAIRLAGGYEDKLLHVHGIGWHHYDGKRWIEDDTREAARAVIATIQDALIESAVTGDKKLRGDATRCESRTGVEGTLGVAAMLPQFAATVRDLDRDLYLLNVANGTLNLHTLELRDHNPRDRLTKVCNASYRPEATSCLWETFLGRVLPNEDVRGYLQRYVGTALCGRVLEHALAILKGEGRNGKGVFYGMVTNALGDYGQTADPDLFMHRENAHPTGEMDLRGARWVVVSENDKNRKLAEATVKRLTGGDPMKARKMRQDFVSFDPSHTAALVTNHLPKVSGDDPALWARLRVIPFDVVIPEPERDVHLAEKLTVELDAILTWIIAGWKEYGQRGKLDEPDAVLKATDKYQADSDDLTAFLRENCMDSAYGHAKFGDLWARWTKWRMEAGRGEVTQKAFGQAMEDRGYSKDKQSNHVIRRGLILLAEDSEAADNA